MKGELSKLRDKANRKMKGELSKLRAATICDLRDLKPHPKNYKEHPPEQLAEIAESINEHGFYRNVVIAKDRTILAGHGVVLAAKNIDIVQIPVIELNIDSMSPAALKILAGDNELSNLGINDNKKLLDVLDLIVDDLSIEGLAETGFNQDRCDFLKDLADDRVLEAGDVDPYAEWEGMPDYTHGDPEARKIVVHFKEEKDIELFSKIIKCKITDSTKFIWFPEAEIEKAVDKRYVSKS